MIAIHDKRIPQVYINSLKDQLPNTEFFAFECPGSTVYASILCHPDIYMFQADANTLVHSPGLPAHLLERLSAYGVDLIEGEKLPAGFYPDTALYNAVRVGGTVFHAFLGERLYDWKVAAKLVRTIAENFRLPYFTLSPTFSVCPIHGYIAGEHKYCPKCDEEIGYASEMRMKAKA